MNYQDYSNAERWLIIIAVMAATLMEVLDTTIINVALPYMQGSLNAAPDQVSWTLTSYMVASGIFMPLAGYFSDRFGRKQYLLYCMGGFTLASILCGASTSLAEIVIFRLLQGAFGAGLVPLSQAIMTDIHSPQDRGKAMAIWGAGVMVGPILGPTLGGYLTDVASWRWAFYVNVPVGIIAALLAYRVVPDTIKKIRGMDWLGLSLISISIGAIQFVLDRGNQDNWFNSFGIQLASFMAVVALGAFIFRNLEKQSHAVFDLTIFKDRNFTVASLMMVIMGLGLYGTMVIQPLLMEELMNYPVLLTGLAMAPRGLSSMISMIIVSKLIVKIDPRKLVAFGIFLVSAGSFMGTFYSLNASVVWFIWPLVLQGFGMGMVFVPLSTMAYSTLPAENRVEAAGLYSLLRTIGGSIGIAVVITIWTRHTQIAWNELAAHIQINNPAVAAYLQPLHLQATDPQGAAVLGNMIIQQAQMVAFVSDYAFIAWSFLAMLPMLLLFKYRKPGPNALNAFDAH
ncbi:MAG: family efflux transporter permease subunit [Gammaproteobacteria bacterium]|jgi:DHA2 family multidrug resistance protein|nr:family efflux transporter permease subunit [Gammaproteobacteria bacterium]